MTEISVGLRGGRAVSLSVEGHTEFSEKGQDIVCAAVSALVQALRFGFESVLKDGNVLYSADSEEPFMALDWRSSGGEGDILVRTVIGSLREIARAYPGNVRIVEVHEQ